MSIVKSLLGISSGALAVACLSSLSDPPHETNDWYGFDFRGAVKSIRVVSYDPIEDDGKTVKGERLEFTSEYGDCAEAFCRLDREGRTVEMRWFGIDDKLLMQTLNIYDSLGNCVEKTAYDSEGLMWKDAAVLDERGRIIRTDQYDADGKVIQQTTYEYDPSGNIASEEISFPNGIMVHRSEYWYDRRGNVTRKSIRVKSEKTPDVWSEVTYIYDPESDLAKEVWMEGDGYKMGDKYEYDENGKVVTWLIYYSEDGLSAKWEYSYDEYGNLTQQKGVCYTVPSEEVWDSVYEYDSYGNWIRETVYCTEDGGSTVANKIVEREIEYYD